MKISPILLFFLCCFNLPLLAQSDSLQVISSPAIDSLQITKSDSTQIEKGVRKSNPLRKFLKKENGLPTPRTSLILSLAVPGAGQVYNGKWWKVPFVYAGIGALGYSINYNTRNYIRLREAFKRKQRDLPHYFSGTRFDDAAVLKSQRDSFDKNRQLSYVGIVVVWLINGIEAFTDAHLMDFDVSDDLSFEFRPVAGEGYSGVGLVIGF